MLACVLEDRGLVGCVEFAYRLSDRLRPTRCAAGGGLATPLGGRLRLLGVDARRFEVGLVVDARLVDVLVHLRERIEVGEVVAVSLPGREHRRAHLPRVVLVVGRDELPALLVGAGLPTPGTLAGLRSSLDNPERATLVTADDRVHTTGWALIRQESSVPKRLGPVPASATMIENRAKLTRTPAHEVALDCIAAGIRAAHPKRVIEENVVLAGDDLQVGQRHIDLSSVDRVLVVGGGKAAGTAAATLEAVLGDRIDDGVVVTDSPVPCDRIRVREGSHPVPDQQGVDGTRALLDLAESATASDLVLAVITGGGSALMVAPGTGISLSDLQATTNGLLQSGAAIGEINTVRKHLSAIKGGRLARRAAPATAVGIVFSDVVGNDLDTIASGPTAPDETTYGDAIAILDRYGVDVPPAVERALDAGARGDRPETPTAHNPAFERVDNRVLADGLTALEAAAEQARSVGYTPLVLSSRVRGEASEAAKTHVGIAEECQASSHPLSPPAVVLSGGETTVTAPGDGEGGPNGEFALSGAIELGERAVVASVDTDGIDGTGGAAGGIVDENTVATEEETSANTTAAREALGDHDSHRFLRAQNGVVRTGPTGTNVNDLRVIVVPE